MAKRKTGKTIPSENTLIDLAELFKIFGDSTRVKILFFLLQGNYSVSEITDALKMSQSAISHQLRILKASRLIKNSREGKSLIYSLADSHVKSILNQGLDHITE